MTSKAQQIELDNALVAPENCRVIGKCNMRINPGMKPKEPTYQIALDALALITCYRAFLITAEGQKFDEPPTEEEALSFIRELGHSGEIKYIIDVIVDHLHQPWRTFVTIINKCLCGKVSGLDKIRLSIVQILWGMYYKKNLDFFALIWEDLAYQMDNIDSKKQDKMFYPRFTKIIIHHFLKKDKSISMRNRMFMHTARDDSLQDSVAYKTYYAIAPGAEPPISRKSQKKSDSAISSEESPSKKKSANAKKVVAPKPKPTKKNTLVKADRDKGLNVLSEVALSEAALLKEATKRSKKDFHISQASGSGDGTDFESGVPDEKHLKTTGGDEETGTIPGVPDVPKYDSESEKESWGDSGEEDEDDENDSEDKSDDGKNDDDGKDGNDGNDDDDDDVNDDDNQEGDDMNDDDEETDNDEEDDEVTKELYKDVNVNLGNEDTEMTNADQGGSEQQNVSQESGFEQVEEDAHIASLMETSARHATAVPEITFGFTITIPLLPSFFNPLPQQATPTLTPKTSEATTLFPSLLDFSFVFKFNDRQSMTFNVTESLEAAVLKRSSSQPQSTYKADAALSEFELTKILIDKMEKNKSYDKADHKRELYDALVKSYQTDKDLFNTYGEVFTLKGSQDDRDKDRDPSARSDRGTKRRKLSKEAESSRDSRSKEKKSSSTSKDASQSQHKHYGKSAHAEEPSHTVDDSGVQKDQEFDMGNNDEQPADTEVSKAYWFKKPKRPPTPDSDWNKRQHVDFRPP
ncbi:hypothetical protein Tco_0295844 [Tanacetum coccineum]